MSGRPRFSVVISTRNRGAMIEPALTSLLALDHRSFEVVVVDQSADSVTGELVRDMSARDERIRYVKSSRVGLSRGRNDGIAEGAGEVIAFTDDDCVVDAGWLNALETELDDPTVAGVFGRVLPNEYRERTGIDLAFKDSEQRVAFSGRTIPWYIGHGANMAFRRDDLVAVGGFDEVLGAGGALPSHEDGDMSYRIMASGRRVVYSPISLVYHRQWRDWDERKRTEHAYGLGAGGQFTKYIRCGDAYGWRLLATWMWQLGVRRVGAGLLKWRSRRVMYLGFAQLVYPWVGMLRSFQFLVNADNLTYVAKATAATESLFGEGFGDALVDGPAIGSAAELSAEISHPVEHR